MTGLVSFSLFGEDVNSVYYAGMVKNAIAYRKNFPDYDLWVYAVSSFDFLTLFSRKSKLLTLVFRLTS